MDDRNLMSTRELSTLTGLSISKITNMLRSGKIKGEKKSGKWRIYKNDLRNQFPNLTPSNKSSEIRTQTMGENGPKPSASGASLSISEFSKLTYLTNFGVLSFIKKGILKGFQDEHGDWRIKADALNSPNIKHLIR